MRWLWLPMFAFFLYLCVDALLDARPWLAVAFLLVGAALSWWLSPWQGGRSARHQEVMQMPESDRPVVVYWRPGCPYCANLRAQLGDLADEAQWINIWQDDEGAAFVRSVNEGNETVPTVVIDGQPLTNPNPGIVKDRLSSRS